MLTQTYPFKLPPLPYAYDALEPYIDTQTMHYHHDKHFQTYINNLNAALEKHPGFQTVTLQQLLTFSNALPEDIRTAVINNGGGVYNHDVFFKGLSSPRGPKHEPEGRLLEMINKKFGSFGAFKEAFTKTALGVFGSGWACLALKKIGGLEIIPLKNQETTLDHDAEPIIIFDVWEHAYYLKYKNLRADYVAGLWNIIDFPKI